MVQPVRSGTNLPASATLRPNATDADSDPGWRFPTVRRTGALSDLAISFSDTQSQTLRQHPVRSRAGSLMLLMRGDVASADRFSPPPRPVQPESQQLRLTSGTGMNAPPGAKTGRNPGKNPGCMTFPEVGKPEAHSNVVLMTVSRKLLTPDYLPTGEDLMPASVRKIDLLIPGILLVIVLVFRGPTLVSQLFAASDTSNNSPAPATTPDSSDTSVLSPTVQSEVESRRSPIAGELPVESPLPSPRRCGSVCH